VAGTPGSGRHPRLAAAGLAGEVGPAAGDSAPAGPRDIVCAYGRADRAAVAQQRADRVPCLVIEPKPEITALLDEHGVPHLAADPAEESVLRRAGVERAAGLLCAVDSDAVNVYITLTARPMNPKLTIVARASNPESVDKLHRAGADQVVSPTTSAAAGWRCSPGTRRSSASWTWSASPRDGGWRRPRSAKVPGWTA
jgi:hypothetical protein